MQEEDPVRRIVNFLFCVEWKESDMEVTLAKMCVLYVRLDYST